MSLLRNLFIGTLFVGLFSCIEDSVVSFQVKVRDDSGKIVPDATIILNGNEIGQSDKNGIFHTNLELKKGEHRIEISKDFGEMNYTPFQQNFLHYRDSERHININAKLYSTPKWAFKNETVDDFPLEEKKTEETASVEKEFEDTISLAMNSEQKKTKPPQISGPKDEVEKLLSSGNPTQAIQLLRKTPKNSKSYTNAWRKIGEIYLTALNNPEKALEAYDLLTHIAQIKNYNNAKYFDIYVNKAIAYFHAAELNFLNDKNESTRKLKNALWITKRVSKLLKNPGAFEQIAELTYYYKALSTHRLWEISQDLKLASDAKNEWTQYQNVMKSLKQKMHPNFLANSETYLKQIQL